MCRHQKGDGTGGVLAVGGLKLVVPRQVMESGLGSAASRPTLSPPAESVTESFLRCGANDVVASKRSSSIVLTGAIYIASRKSSGPDKPHKNQSEKANVGRYYSCDIISQADKSKSSCGIPSMSGFDPIKLSGLSQQ